MGALEAVIALAILSIVLGAAFQLTTSSFNAAGQGTSSAVMDMRAGRLLDRVTTELMSAGFLTLDPPSPAGSPEIAFKKCTGYDAGALEWSPLCRIAWAAPAKKGGMASVVWGGGATGTSPVAWLGNVPEYLEGELPNGKDDNGNGLVDERGLCFSLSGRTLTVRLSVCSTTSKGAVLTRTFTTSVHLRN
jgi:hypothetical protein